MAGIRKISGKKRGVRVGRIKFSSRKKARAYLAAKHIHCKK
jgi:hypothetical protein